MRLYSLGNMYLLAIQAGIQSQHCTAELSVKYGREKSLQSDMYYDWAKNHKVTILLNGGMQTHLEDFVSFLESTENPYPWAKFNESMEALNGALTNVSVVLPEKIYMYKKWTSPEMLMSNVILSEDGQELTLININEDCHEVNYRYSKWELELINRISGCQSMK